MSEQDSRASWKNTLAYYLHKKCKLHPSLELHTSIDKMYDDILLKSLQNVRSKVYKQQTL
jgi:hypothetical protein